MQMDGQEAGSDDKGHDAHLPPPVQNLHGLDAQYPPQMAVEQEIPGLAGENPLEMPVQPEQDQLLHHPPVPHPQCEGINAQPVLVFPSPFCDFKISEVNVKEAINSTNSYNYLLNMLSFGNSYLKSGPVLGDKKVIFEVISETDENSFYKVVISEKSCLAKKYQRGSYRNYNYSCECKSNKVGLSS